MAKLDFYRFHTFAEFGFPFRGWASRCYSCFDDMAALVGMAL
jgi:hypothetical protein